MLIEPKSERPLTADEREALILQHLPQVRWIVNNLQERLPGTILQEDLFSAGVLGLIAAIDNFDPSRNTTLKTYAEYKIRGAILDSIRGLDGVPPHQRKRAREVQAAMNSAEQKLQRVPTEEEIAQELGTTLEEYRQTLFNVRGVTLGALDTVGESGPGMLRYLADREELSPGWILERSELQSLLATAIEHLPKIERTVIGLYFMEELTLVEIGGLLNLHLSRVSQLKQQAILRLRSGLRKRWPDTNKG